MKYPRSNSLEAQALARFLHGHHISHQDFQKLTCSYRLSHFVYALRKKGWMVDSQDQHGKTNDPTGRVADYVRYSLSPETIRKAGEKGQTFAAKVRMWEEMRMRTRGAATPKANIKVQVDSDKGGDPCQL